MSSKSDGVDIVDCKQQKQPTKVMRLRQSNPKTRQNSRNKDQQPQNPLESITNTFRSRDPGIIPNKSGKVNKNKIQIKNFQPQSNSFTPRGFYLECENWGKNLRL